MKINCPSCHQTTRIDNLPRRGGQQQVQCAHCEQPLQIDLKISLSSSTAGKTQLSEQARLAALGQETEEFRIPGRPGRLLGLLISLLLIALLVLQQAYFRRNEWSTIPQLRPWLETLCQYTDCQLPPQREAEHIGILEREIRKHPTIDHALLVRVVLENRAPFDQQLPQLQLSFFDARRQLLAVRHFTPQEYLPADQRTSTIMVAGQVIESRLVIEDPGPQAIGFEFAFHY